MDNIGYMWHIKVCTHVKCIGTYLHTPLCTCAVCTCRHLCTLVDIAFKWHKVSASKVHHDMTWQANTCHLSTFVASAHKWAKCALEWLNWTKQIHNKSSFFPPGCMWTTMKENWEKPSEIFGSLLSHRAKGRIDMHAGISNGEPEQNLRLNWTKLILAHSWDPRRALLQPICPYCMWELKWIWRIEMEAENTMTTAWPALWDENMQETQQWLQISLPRDAKSG